MIHLDTSFLIRALVTDSPQDRALREWLRENSLAISSIGWAEFLCGPIEPHHVELAERVVSNRVAFEEDHALLTARLFNETGRRRGSLTDCMIAATALHASAPLATVDTKHFRRFEAAGLQTIVI